MVQSFENLYNIFRNWAKDNVQKKILVNAFIEQVQEKQKEER